MSYRQNFKDYSIKKCKNFGYTFSIIFFLLSIYSFFVINSFLLPFTFLSFFFFTTALFAPQSFKFFGYYWEQFGYLLGKFFSPLILSMVYLITIVPINLILRAFKIDILNKHKTSKIQSYWVERKEKNISFKDQY